MSPPRRSAAHSRVEGTVLTQSTRWDRPLGLERAGRGAQIGSSGMRWLAHWRNRTDRAPEVAVHRDEARLDDHDALERLLGVLPQAEELRARLEGRFFARAWDADRHVDYWIASDGTRVTCYTLQGLSLQQAAEVRVKWDALKGRIELNEDRLADMVARQTGQLVTLLG